MIENFKIGIDIVSVKKFKKNIMKKIEIFIRRFFLLMKLNIVENIKIHQKDLQGNLL